MSTENTTPHPVRERIAALDWEALRHSLNELGYAVMPRLLQAEECEQMMALYEDESRFRSRIDMKRYRFGQGEYKYLDHPLPGLITTLRTDLYPHLAAVANEWEEKFGGEAPYPLEHHEFLERCHAEEQLKPTPLLLRYEAGGYNCLHQDLYGDVAFPFQVVFVLNNKDIEYTGGEFLLVEQRPRAQSRGHVITLEQGQGLIFPTRHRPVAGVRGTYRATLRHGVSTLHSGIRYSLGIIFHDAK